VLRIGIQIRNTDRTSPLDELTPPSYGDHHFTLLFAVDHLDVGLAIFILPGVTPSDHLDI
jgi:hypothetical protein